MSPPPPPAKRGIISRAIFAGIFAILTLTAAPPVAAQAPGTVTIAVTANDGDRDLNTPGLQVDEDDHITITWTAHGITAGTISVRTTISGGTSLDIGQSSDPIIFLPGLGNSIRTQIPNDNTPEPDQTITISVGDITITSPTTPPGPWTAGDPSSVTFTVRANDGYVAPVAPAPPPVVMPGTVTDNPAARSDRLDAPAGAAARGVGQLAAVAVAKRLHAAASANQFNLGRATTAEELLHGGSFNLAGGDGGRGFNFWGSGEYVSAEGDHDGVDYDGDTSAFTLGIDTGWRDGLVGVAVSRSDGDVDFTVTADGMKSTLETEVTGVHPYLTRRLNRSQLYLTAGHGNGDAELKEPDATIKTDLTVTTAAFGITHARGELFTAGLSALYSRAKLDAATGGGKTLPATTADTIRITASGEAGWTRGAWRPFITLRLRHDSGDGDTGGAADLGGGVEWRAPTVLVRLAGSGHIQGQAADEQRASLTVRKSSGNFDLGLNLGMDNAGLDTARLLTGEWRF